MLLPRSYDGDSEGRYEDVGMEQIHAVLYTRGSASTEVDAAKSEAEADVEHMKAEAYSEAGRIRAEAEREAVAIKAKAAATAEAQRMKAKAIAEVADMLAKASAEAERLKAQATEDAIQMRREATAIRMEEESKAAAARVKAEAIEEAGKIREDAQVKADAHQESVVASMAQAAESAHRVRTSFAAAGPMASDGSEYSRPSSLQLVRAEDMRSEGQTPPSPAASRLASPFKKLKREGSQAGEIGNNALTLFKQSHGPYALGGFAELIHNAVDAAATTLQIDYEPEGAPGGRIRIHDDGFGMTHTAMHNMLLFGRGQTVSRHSELPLKALCVL